MRLMRNWGRRGLDVIGRIWIGGGKVGRRMGLVISLASFVWDEKWGRDGDGWLMWAMGGKRAISVAIVL